MTDSTAERVARIVARSDDAEAFRLISELPADLGAKALEELFSPERLALEGITRALASGDETDAEAAASRLRERGVGLTDALRLHFPKTAAEALAEGNPAWLTRQRKRDIAWAAQRVAGAGACGIAERTETEQLPST